MEIKLSRCTLRPWRTGDEASLARYANNRNVSGNLKDRFPFPYTSADATEWIAHVAGQAPTCNFAIVVDGEAVGGTGIEVGDDVFRRSAEVGYWLAARVLEKAGYTLEGRMRDAVVKNGRVGDRLIYGLLRP